MGKSDKWFLLRRSFSGVERSCCSVKEVIGHKCIYATLTPDNLLWLRKPLDYESVRRFLDRWQPFGGLIYFHLLLDGLLEEGYL
jgi:hypothetical protein